MAVSIETAKAVAKILVEELGIEKAEKVLRRLKEETKGNQSYRYSLGHLIEIVRWIKEKI